MIDVRSRAATGLVVLAAVFSLAACGSGSATIAGTPAAGGPPVSAGTSTTPAPDAPLVPLQKPDGGVFASPTANISCEIDAESAYCQTVQPARSVTMDPRGNLEMCEGEQCLGNTGEGVITLAYGQATEAGPFRCESAATGVTCLADGKGFQISSAGVKPATR